MNKNNRNLQLDCLRGIAALLVIGVHFHWHVPEGHPLWYLEALWRRVGLVGVDLFFVLSGFLIGSLLLSEIKKYGHIDISRFLIRRGFKLYPVYYVFIGYCIVRLATKAHSEGGDFSPALWASGREFVTSILFIQNYIPPCPAGHTWSLAVEEHFYIVLPFVLAFLGARRVWKWMVPICLSAVPVCLVLRIISVVQQTSQSQITIGTQLNSAATHLHFDGLMVGVALAVVAINSPQRFVSLGRFPNALIAGGIVLWMLALLPLGYPLYWGTLGFTLRVVGSAAILIGVCSQHGHVEPKRGLLARIGSCSYAIYVWHTTVMGITEKALGGFLTDRLHSPPLRWVVMSVVLIVCCVLAGAVVTLLIERPCLALRDKWLPSRGRAIAFPRPNGSSSSAMEGSLRGVRPGTV